MYTNKDYMYELIYLLIYALIIGILLKFKKYNVV